MKKILAPFFSLIVIHLYSFELQSPHAMAINHPASIPSLRQLCINKIAFYAQSDSRYNASSLAGLPNDLAHSLLETLKGRITLEHKATLPGTFGLVCPDGSHVLVDNSESSNKDASVIYTTMPFRFRSALEDGHNHLKHKWSPSGRYVYALGTSHVAKIYSVWESKTGKKIYPFPYHAKSKLYFSLDDKLLLHHMIGQPLQVYRAQTGAHVKNIGEKIYTGRQPRDPQSKWLACFNDTNRVTELYDAVTFDMVKTLPGRLVAFNKDGAYLAIKKKDENSIALFNRSFETKFTIAIGENKGRVEIVSPGFLVLFNTQNEWHYSLETGKQIKHFTHVAHENQATYSNSIGTATIKIQRNNANNCTITVQNENEEPKTVMCPHNITHIRYTNHSQIVALCAHLEAKYLLNHTTGTLIPCDIPIKGKWKFKYEPICSIALNGYLVSYGKEIPELKRLHICTQLTSIIDMLSKKIDQA